MHWQIMTAVFFSVNFNCQAFSLVNTVETFWNYFALKWLQLQTVRSFS